MKKISIKQGTRAWENAKETRIGSSEIFDIVRYYAKDSELYNCGIDAKKFKEETPFVSTWALYHKILRDGIYTKPLLDPSLAEYGLAMENYGLRYLQEGRRNKLKKGQVYISDKLIASLDISGVSEEVDVRSFDYGSGSVGVGEKFVCEQKTISPYKDHLPLKYVIQAQYQITMSKSSYFVLQAMILNEDTPFERGKIVALANTNKSKFFDYVKDKVKIQHIYFNNNEALAQLIKICIDRFFESVEKREEPTPFIQTDNISNIIISIRQNSFYNPNLTKEYDLAKYAKLKKECDLAELNKKQEMQKIIEFIMANNCSRLFDNASGYSASFTSNGRFLLKEPKEFKDD